MRTTETNKQLLQTGAIESASLETVENTGIELSDWIVIDGYCATRVYKNSRPDVIMNRVAFIEKTPRIRVAKYSEKDDQKNWYYGPRGTSDYGFDEESRNWCDLELRKRGYIF